jgi:hypothetical protein
VMAATWLRQREKRTPYRTITSRHADLHSDSREGQRRLHRADRHSHLQSPKPLTKACPAALSRPCRALIGSSLKGVGLGRGHPNGSRCACLQQNPAEPRSTTPRAARRSFYGEAPGPSGVMARYPTLARRGKVLWIFPICAERRLW